MKYNILFAAPMTSFRRLARLCVILCDTVDKIHIVMPGQFYWFWRWFASAIYFAIGVSRV